MAIKLGLIKGCHDMLPSDDLAGLFLCKKDPGQTIKPVWSPYISHPPGLTLAVMTMYALVAYCGCSPYAQARFRRP